jgi:hypothetical protein
MAKLATIARRSPGAPSNPAAWMKRTRASSIIAASATLLRWRLGSTSANRVVIGWLKR